MRRTPLVVGVLVLVLAGIGCDAPSAAVGAPPPAAPPASAPSAAAPVSYTVRFSPGPYLPGMLVTVALSRTDGQPISGVVWELPTSGIVELTLTAQPWIAQLQLLASGQAEIVARIGDVRVRRVLTVDPLPPATDGLVVERFYLYLFDDPYAPPGTRSYLPMVRLRVPTGADTLAVVGLSASMPSAPALQGCSFRPARTLTPGVSQDVLGLDRYFNEPEFWFGPYAPRDTIGPVTLTLQVKDRRGTTRGLLLSKVMTEADVSRETPRIWEESVLSCP